MKFAKELPDEFPVELAMELTKYAGNSDGLLGYISEEIFEIIQNGISGGMSNLFKENPY